MINMLWTSGHDYYHVFPTKFSISPHRPHIPGLQAHLWTEMVRTRSQLHQMAFPRLLAAAERAWHGAPWEQVTGDAKRRQAERHLDWTRFVNTLGYRELRRLESMGIEFYLPPPGAMYVTTFPDKCIPLVYNFHRGYRRSREQTFKYI